MHVDCRTIMTCVTVLSVSLQVSQVSITDDDAQINRKLPKELLLRYNTKINEPVHETSNNVVCATSKASDQPAHMHSLIRAFASRLCSMSVKLLTDQSLC